jgi:ATP-dependent protease ClpP protease subunit
MKVFKRKCGEPIDNEKTIFNEGSHIYFYDEVSRENILRLRILINEVNNLLDSLRPISTFFDKLFRRTPKDYSPSIKLHINSYGGSVDASVNIIDVIEMNRYPITTIAEGYVASAAADIFLAGHKRHIQKSTLLLIHQMRGHMLGTQSDIKDEMYNWELVDNMMIDLYMRKSDNLNEEQAAALMEDEKALTAEDALTLGLVDKIL